MTGQPDEAPHDDAPHEHARPDLADMRASLAVARAILLGDDPGAHAAASAGSCPACTAMAGISFGITLASTFAGDKTLVSEPIRLAMLDAIASTEGELRAAPN
jgi:hypothetical protein